MKIRRVKKDYNDLCFSIPINILGVFAGEKLPDIIVI